MSDELQKFVDVSQENWKQDLREYSEWIATNPGRHTAWEIWHAAADATRYPGVYVEDPSEIKP